MSDDLEAALRGDEEVQPVRRSRKTKDDVPLVRLVLSENDDIPPTGLYVGLNGKGWLIRPGEEVLVPQGIVDILENAITSVPTQDPSTQQVIGWRDRLRYPYRVLN